MSLDCTVDGHVATITITNPAKRNAMTPAMWESLPPLLDGLAADDGVRVVVLTGAGGTFCAGADIGALPDIRHAGRDLATHAEQALAAFPKPTVAAIRGYCVGGGVQLAAACDLRLADDNARFGVTPAKIGIVYPVVALARLVELIGPAHTKTLLFTADLIDAATAHQYGLIDQPVPGADLDRRVSALTATLAERSQLTLQATKDIVDALAEPAMAVAAERYRRWLDQVLSSGEADEGIAAFLERRAPAFPWTRQVPVTREAAQSVRE
jgi:enoyl-CoA hydratase/carnithine racemase